MLAEARIIQSIATTLTRRLKTSLRFDFSPVSLLADGVKPLPCMTHPAREVFAASLAHSRSCGSRTAQECGHDSGGTYSHRSFQGPCFAPLLVPIFIEGFPGGVGID